MSRIKVLVLAPGPFSADPTSPASRQHAWLRVDDKMREIRARIRPVEYGDSLDFEADWTGSARDLIQTLSAVRPDVVHFVSLGNENGDALFGEGGAAQSISKEALVVLLGTMKDTIRVVVLGASFTQTQAEGIARVIDCVVMMGTRISDDAATAFAASFYRALGSGRSVQSAFHEGIA